MEVNKDVNAHEDDLEHDLWAIKALKLEKVYSTGVQALQPIYFGVKHGEILGIVGPRESGKSTIQKCLSLEHSMSSYSQVALALDEKEMSLSDFNFGKNGIDVGLLP
jgi:ABC-type phosphate/phosphonate transport system ATPase subunit